MNRKAETWIVGWVTRVLFLMQLPAWGVRNIMVGQGLSFGDYAYVLFLATSMGWALVQGWSAFIRLCDGPIKKMLIICGLYIAVHSYGLVFLILQNSEMSANGFGRILILVMVVVYSALNFHAPPYGRSPDKAYYDLGAGLFAYILLSFLAYAAFGSGSLADFKLVEASNKLGLFSTRLIYPTSNNPALFAVTMGCAVIMGVLRPGCGTILRWGLVLGGSIGLAAAGYRSVALLTACMCLLTRIKVIMPFAGIGAILLPILIPVIFLSGLPEKATRPLEKMDILLSRGVDELLDLNRRTEVWTAVYGELRKRQGVGWLFGSGMYGHVSSGLSIEYSWVLEDSFTDPYSKTTHNTALQILVDYGVVGFTIIWICLAYFISWLWRHGNMAYYTVVIFLLLNGIFQTTLTYMDHIGITLLFIMLWICLVNRKARAASNRL
jgi:hypothetical protein